MNPLVEARRIALAGRLQETSIAFEAGALVGLIGPNGSGKTSLLHALAGIGSRAGDVTIGGMTSHDAGPERRQRLLAYLPASRDIAWPLRALDAIRLGSPDEAYLPRVLGALELAPFLDRPLDGMSTGERSRVLIARALAARPKLLLLDEPVANLDPLWQLRLMDFLAAETRENGQAALVALHDLDLAEAYADRLLIMHEGRMAADGAPAALLEGPDVPRIFGIARVGGRWRPVT